LCNNFFNLPFFRFVPDFPDRIANSTLQQKPSPLFLSNSHRNSNIDSSDSDLDSDSGYSSPLHKRNQVSNGTHPAGYIETVTFSKNTPNQSESRTVETAKSVPQQKMSYAMIAQKVPTSTSHITCVHTENSSSNNQGCDNTNRNTNTNCDPHWSRDSRSGTHKSHINSRYNGDSSAEISKNKEGKPDVETKGNDGENVVGDKKKRKRNRKRKRKKGDGSKVEDNEVIEREDVELHFEDEEEFPDLLENENKNLSRKVTHGLRESNPCILEDRIMLESDESLVMSTPASYLQNQNNNYSGSSWRNNSGQNAWGSNKREVTPNAWQNRSSVEDASVVHVGPVIAHSHQDSVPVMESPVVMGTPSYSEILKTVSKTEMTYYWFIHVDKL